MCKQTLDWQDVLDDENNGGHSMHVTMQVAASRLSLPRQALLEAAQSAGQARWRAQRQAARLAGVPHRTALSPSARL